MGEGGKTPRQIIAQGDRLYRRLYGQYSSIRDKSTPEARSARRRMMAVLDSVNRYHQNSWDYIANMRPGVSGEGYDVVVPRSVYAARKNNRR